MLRQNIQPPGPEFLAVALAFVDCLLGRSRLEEFEAVARDEQRAAGLVQPVVGPPDTLEQPRRALGRPHLHHQVDVAPVDTQVETGGRHERTKFAPGHRTFDLAACLAAQRAMMNPDRKIVIVHIPQVLEDVLRQESRVGEDQRRSIGTDLFVELRYRPGRCMSAPGDPLF